MNCSTQSAADAGDVCLQQLTDLRHELEVAMDAIARNALPELEQSLWRQEMLCEGLKRSLVAVNNSVQGRHRLNSMRREGKSLRNVNRTYETLIAQSQRTAALLQDLCGFYRNAASRDAGSEPTSLSCEA